MSLNQPLHWWLLKNNRYVPFYHLFWLDGLKQFLNHWQQENPQENLFPEIVTLFWQDNLALSTLWGKLYLKLHFFSSLFHECLLPLAYNQ